MTALRRTPCFGKALAAGVLLVLVGCQQVPSRVGTQSPRDGKPELDGAITPAQEADVQISMGRVAEKRGDLEQAMGAYRAALTRDGRRADAYLRLAVLHDKQGKFRESAELYRKALALRPGDPEIYCDMGYSYYLQRRWAESEMSLRQAIAVDGDHRRAHNNLALLLAHDDRLENALAEFGRAGNSPPEAHMNLGFVLTMERRWEPAQAEYQRALALDPSSQVAKDRLGQLNALVAKMDKPRGGAPKDSPLMTTSVAAPAPRREVSTAIGMTTAITQPAENARTRAVFDPGVITTASNVNPPGWYRRSSLPLPSLPVDDGSTRDFWATVESGTSVATRRQPGPPPAPQSASPERQDSRPQPDTVRSEGASHGPLLAIDAQNPARPSSGRPKRPTIPPPRPPKAATTARPSQARSTPSTSTVKSQANQISRPTESTAMSSPSRNAQIQLPAKFHDVDSDGDTSGNPQTPDVPPLRSIP